MLHGVRKLMVSMHFLNCRAVKYKVILTKRLLIKRQVLPINAQHPQEAEVIRKN